VCNPCLQSRHCFARYAWRPYLAVAFVFGLIVFLIVWMLAGPEILFTFQLKLPEMLCPRMRFTNAGASCTFIGQVVVNQE
jgi:hypothetical protein